MRPRCRDVGLFWLLLKALEVQWTVTDINSSSSYLSEAGPKIKVPMNLAAILGAVLGVVALVIVVAICVWFGFRRRMSRTSESNSSDHSVGVGQNIELLGGASASSLNGTRCFKLEELKIASKNFSETHLIGSGRFGEVYKGLLPDMIVAIKRRIASPNEELVEEVQYLSTIRHRNLVSLIGYCQEDNEQILIYEYIPNGSVSTHLYGSNQNSSEKLEFKHRLSIAYGTAKGLAHLHSLNPLLIHKDFKTVNVLVDDNFIPKVADAGLRSMLDKINGAGPSTPLMDDDLFLDPEVRQTGRFSEKSDAYSFGVFVLELVSGRPITLHFSRSADIVEWAQGYRKTSDISSLIDRRMRPTYTAEGMRELFQLAVWCLNPSQGGRPPMSFVVSELERIQEKEMSLTTVMGERTPVVTLGSQLFTSSK